MGVFKIPEAIKRFLEESDSMNLATTDRNGQPSAANKFMLKVEGDIIYIVDFIRGKTWKNLQYNPFISLTVVDKENLIDYQINGTAAILENGNEYDLLMKELSEKEIRFATNRVIEGVQRVKSHQSFAFPLHLHREVIIIKMKVEGIIEIGPTAELRKEGKVIVGIVKDSPILEIFSRFLKKAKYYLGQYPELTRLIGLFWVLGIGAIDYSTGYEIGVSSFYLIPIIMVTWVVNKKAGLYTVFLSTVTWIAAEVMTRGVSYPNFIIFWNACIRLTFFLIIVQLLSSLKIRLEKEQELSSHDYLTGAANSRYFFELAERELKRMLRGKDSFSLGYIDVDNFKQINDSAGHSVGDALLKVVAATMKNSTREIDVVGRLGGDEFAVLMPLTGYDGAQAVVSRLRRQLEDSMREHKWGVGFSIGLITFTEPPATVDEMVRLADEQMYIAKRNGKNTVKHTIFDKKAPNISMSKEGV